MMSLLELSCCCHPSSMFSTWFAQLNGARQWGQHAWQVLVYLRTPSCLSSMHKHVSKTSLLGCCTPQNTLPEVFVRMEARLNRADIECSSAPGYIVCYA